LGVILNPQARGTFAHFFVSRSSCIRQFPAGEIQWFKAHRSYNKGFPHGMPTTHADTINADLLAFLKA
jgi:hypothetical protein